MENYVLTFPCIGGGLVSVQANLLSSNDKYPKKKALSGPVSHFLSQKSEISENLPCITKVYIAHFTTQKGDIGQISGINLGVFQINSVCWFGQTPSRCRRCPELTGGGLVRSAGGWRAVKEAYRVGIRVAGDERILGSSEFVETTLKQAGEAYNRKTRLQSAGMNLSALIAAVCRYLKVDEKELSGPTRRPEIARARALVGLLPLGSCRFQEAMWPVD